MALKCYEKCIECEESEQQAAGHYKEAANCVKSSDTDKYVEYTNKAIYNYSMSGRHSTAANMAKECANQLEEDYDYESAIEFFDKAA